MRRHARVFREVVKRALVQGVPEHDANMFGGGITRRSPRKGHRVKKPWVASRTLFCQGIAPKIFAAAGMQKFRALDNDVSLKSKQARSSPLLRALIAKFIFPRKTRGKSTFSRKV